MEKIDVLEGEFALCEALLYDFGKHLLDVEACCTHLLGNEAGGGHARCGVYLQEVELVTLGDDIVDADDTMATQDVIKQ